MDKKERQAKIGKYGLGGVFLFVLCGLIYGLWHDFTPEYEATHKYGPPQYVWNDETGEIEPYKEGDPYPTRIFVDEETGQGYFEDGSGIRHGAKSTNFRIAGNKVIPLTPLDEEGLKIQEEDGCIACHDKK